MALAPEEGFVNKRVHGDAVKFNLSASHTHEEGQVHWNDADKTIDVDTNVTGVALQVGQENYIRATNKTGVTINDGELVYINGAQGNRPTITLAKADAVATSSVVAMATHDMANNDTGFVSTFGLVRDIDTNAFTEGDALFLSAATAGAYTNVMPSAPNFIKKVGTVVTKSATVGAILLTIDNTPVENFVFQELTVNGVLTADEVIGELYQEGASTETADSITLNTGTVASGSVTDTRQINNVYYQVNEVSGTPGFDAEFIFSLDDNPGKLIFKGRYQGSGGHNVVVEAWNYTAGTWDSFTGSGSDLPSSTTDYELEFDYNDLAGAITDYISGTASKVRAYHSSPGNATHDLYVDYIAISVQQVVVATAGTYQTVTGFTAGESNNVTLNATNGTMTIVEAGKYAVNMVVSFGGTDSTTFEGHLFVDDVKVDKIGAKRRLGTTGDVGTTGFTGIMDLAAAEVLKIKFTADVGGSYIAIDNINFNIHRIN